MKNPPPSNETRAWEGLIKGLPVALDSQLIQVAVDPPNPRPLHWLQTDSPRSHDPASGSRFWLAFSFGKNLPVIPPQLQNLKENWSPPPWYPSNPLIFFFDFCLPNKTKTKKSANKCGVLWFLAKTKKQRMQQRFSPWQWYCRYQLRGLGECYTQGPGTNQHTLHFITLGTKKRCHTEGSDWNQQIDSRKDIEMATQYQIIQYELIQLKARESQMFFSR